MRMNYSDFTAVIPTLNEERTIGEMIAYISRNYRGMHMLVVDDGSTDRTREVVLKAASANRRVHFLDRHTKYMQRGLTASVVYGILNSATKYAIVIDADMQHPPGKIGDVAAMLGSGSDLVVANRSRITGWALYRRLISRAFMYAGKIILFLEGKETCVDIFSGFFGVEKKLFMEVYKRNRRRFVGGGYKVLFDFLKCVDRGTLRISNVPFVFNIRKHGSSKAGFGQGIALINSFFS